MQKRSCKGSITIGHLEAKLNEIDYISDTSRSSRFNRALLKAQNYSLEELKECSMELKKFKTQIRTGISYPTALQVTVDEKLEGALEAVEINMMSALNLSKLQTRYEVELLFFILYQELKKERIEAGKDPSNAESMSGSEMVKRLVEILLLNREEDKVLIEEVKSVLLKWEV